ncbi:MAG: hypothetical protein WAT21_07620 [Saprospiraceae bacterium]
MLSCFYAPSTKKGDATLCSPFILQRTRLPVPLLLKQGQTSPWLNLKNQVFLGSDVFVARISQQINGSKDLQDIPASQRWSIPKPLKYYGDTIKNRNAAITCAYKSGGYSMKEVGEYFGLSYSMVSRIIKDSIFKT